MWFLPSFERPERCQVALDHIADAGPSEGVVIVDGGNLEGYSGLRYPDGWRGVVRSKNLGVCATLNRAFEQFPDEPWYGFVSDDSLVRTPGWSAALVRAAGSNGIANSGDGWQANKRLHGAVVFGGDLLRAFGAWAPSGLKHCFVDDAWERLAYALGNWTHVPQVLVEHRHRNNGKAEDDGTYAKAYSTFDNDLRAFRIWGRDECPKWIDRAIPIVAAGNAQRARLMRARSRSVMIATPIARHPCYQYTLSLVETVQLLERQGIEHGRQFVVGSSKLPSARNELVARFLASDCTDMLFIDDDMGWDANSVIRALASPHPITAVVGRKRVDKPVTDRDVWCGTPRCAPDGTGLIQDDMGFLQFERVGTGFMKIAREAFEAIIAAHPEWKRAGHDGMSPEVKAKYYRFFHFADDDHETGEDVGFCDSWRALGGEVWVDPEQTMSHVGEKAYVGRFADLLISRDAAAREIAT